MRVQLPRIVELKSDRSCGCMRPVWSIVGGIESGDQVLVYYPGGGVYGVETVDHVMAFDPSRRLEPTGVVCGLVEDCGAKRMGEVTGLLDEWEDREHERQERGGM
jgi:hypothetical protein